MSHLSGPRIFKRYSEAFKQKVVSEIESGVLTIHQAQKRYRIGSHGTIAHWFVGRDSYLDIKLSILENRPTELLYSLSHSHIFSLSTLTPIAAL